MSNVDDDDNLDLEVNDDTDNNNGMKSLRKAKDKADRDNKELRDQLAKLQSKDRTRDLAEFLDNAKAPKRLAKYAARDIEGDVTEETVNEWLKENGADFGWEPEASDDADDDAAELRENARRISNASQNAPEAKTGMTVDRIKNMSPAELVAAGIVVPD